MTEIKISPWKQYQRDHIGKFGGNVQNAIQVISRMYTMFQTGPDVLNAKTDKASVKGRELSLIARLRRKRRSRMR